MEVETNQFKQLNCNLHKATASLYRSDPQQLASNSKWFSKGETGATEMILIGHFLHFSKTDLLH